MRGLMHPWIYGYNRAALRGGLTIDAAESDGGAHRRRGPASTESIPTARRRLDLATPRGLALTCRGWEQEGALRCLLNNLDPAVAERPDDLVVYGGAGKAARNWDCLHAIVARAARARSRPRR